MRSLELTFDDETDDAVRTDWHRLAAAGLPSLASHTAPSNRPHITLAAGPALADSAAAPPPPSSSAPPPTPSAPPSAQLDHPESAELVRGLPLDIRFGAVVLFPAGADRFVLARSIVVSRQLLELHAAAHRVVTGSLDTSLPDRWTPHVTIARRLSAEQVARALLELGDIRLGRCSELRWWDGDTKTVTVLSHRSDETMVP